MRKIILVLFTCLLAFPLQALAYSYGDPTKEDIAETFRLIKGHLDLSPPDWKSAAEAYKVRRAEISSHFGESIAVTLDENIKNEQKAEFITNYRYVLYINIDRRFTYARKDINDYGKAKLLVAKAKGTYDVLKPYIQSKMPNKIQEIEAAFDKALEALGNPGLFGVGQKPIEPDEFDKQTNFILATLKPIFSYNEAKSTTNEQQNKENTTENKEPEKEPSTSPSNESDQQSSTSKTEKPTTEQSNKKTENENKKAEKSTTIASNETEKEAEKEVTTELKEESIEEIKENEEKETVKDEHEKSALQPVPEQPKEQDDTTVASNNTSIEIAAEASADHAPMERSSKTNPFVTIGVVASVIILGAGGIFFAKRKNLI